MKESPYPVLRDRPIDQWKVTELKDELKRRKLTVKGLKEDLVRRLDEALRIEMESSNQEEVENVNDDDDDSQSKGQDHADEKAPIVIEPLTVTSEVDGGVGISVKDADQADDKKIEVEDVSVQTTPITIEPLSETLTPEVEGDQAGAKNVEADNISVQNVEDDNMKISDEDLGQQAGELTHASPPVNDEQSVEMGNAASDNVLSEAALAGQASEDEQTGNENSDSKSSDKEVKPVNLSDQVSEVSPSLGFPVKNVVSVSNDSISINEKTELKDDIIADDFKLEFDVKHEMVQPSSSPLGPDGGKSRPMDVEEPQSKVSLDETEKTVKEEDMMSKKNSSADLGSPEKLNLDGDDSMEEDTLENKQVDYAYNLCEVGGRGEKTDVNDVKEDATVDIVFDDLSAVKNDGHVEDMSAIAAPTEKRKLPDNQEALANNEPSKRQRRWKTESVKASEPQNSSPAIDMPTTPRGVPQALGSKRSFSRSNSNADDDDAPKERVVPPSEPATDSLKITNFLRPFTLKAVQELLGKTGTVTSFWMDHIKTHCYVTYSSVEEATETRNAVYNLQWPPNGGKLLVAEFVDVQEVKSHMEAPPQLPSPVAPSAPPVAALQPSPRQLGPRQKQLLQTNLPPPPPLANPPPVRERLLPPPPPLEKVEPPAVTLDDLFRKTKATPRIYYLPLSEEQVKAKMEGQHRKVL